MSAPRLVAAITNVNMGLGHEGLGRVAKKFGYSLERLEDRELVLFINRARDKLKLLGSKGIVLGYVRMPRGRKLPGGAVQFIPETFSASGAVNIDAAIEKYLLKVLAASKLPRSPLEIVRAQKGQ